MASKTISLEESAYEKLLAAKRTGESFSGVIHRLLSDRQPALVDFQGLLDPRDAKRLAGVVARMKRADIEAQRQRGQPRGS